MADLDDDLERTLRESPLWREKDNLLRSVPEIGRVVSITLSEWLDFGQTIELDALATEGS